MSDPDSQRRELKTAIAAAETKGDQATVKRLRGELDKLNAGTSRAAAAVSNPDAVKTPPTGRTSAPAKSTTAKTP